MCISSECQILTNTNNKKNKKEEEERFPANPVSDQSIHLSYPESFLILLSDLQFTI